MVFFLVPVQFMDGPEVEAKMEKEFSRKEIERAKQEALLQKFEELREKEKDW